MRKSYLSFLVAVFLVFASVGTANAALLTFSSKGEVFWDVLGASSDSAIEVKKVADKAVSDKSTSVNLENNGGKVLLSYGGENKVDITGYNNDIVQIEEKSSPETISVEATSSGFAIKQRDVTATTDFPIKINSPQNQIAVSTKNGDSFLGVMPFDVVDQLKKASIITDLSDTDPVVIGQAEDGVVTYNVDGIKKLKILKIVDLDVNIKVAVSASSGNVIKVDQPIWYSLAGFLFS